MARPKKCPKCNSTRIIVNGTVFYCEKCGFINKQDRVIIRSK